MKTANLTPVQLEIVRRTADGQTRKQIADGLGISVKTVDYHFVGCGLQLRQSIYAKTKTNCTALLVRWAVRAGIVSCLIVICGCQAPSPRSSVKAAPGRVVSFAWDPSPSPEVTGYRLYTGSASRNYTNMVNVGTNRTASVTNPPSPLFAAATAYAANGAESDFSNEVTNRNLTTYFVVSVVTNSGFSGVWKPDARFGTVRIPSNGAPALFFKVGWTEVIE